MLKMLNNTVRHGVYCTVVYVAKTLEPCLVCHKRGLIKPLSVEVVQSILQRGYSDKRDFE